ncbi:hypothetical protein A2130_03075 [Candidatus Woesebacteria bacterium GWC2_33_12]|nr:MAG: hypothetical protein A2130_03075 [Candidatus Woesebacteria bacterium GWC2_33_12]OGM78642.1 MAG: hypothetical protein A2366_02825 [Candidatus Woesebacteria bacterium RIFOXYB1_FULL_33_9]
MSYIKEFINLLFQKHFLRQYKRSYQGLKDQDTTDMIFHLLVWQDVENVEELLQQNHILVNIKMGILLHLHITDVLKSLAFAIKSIFQKLILPNNYENQSVT